MLASNDLIQVCASTGEPLGQWMNVDLEGKRTAVPVAELGGDIGGWHPSSGQEGGGRVPERMHMDCLWQADRVDEPAELR